MAVKKKVKNRELSPEKDGPKEIKKVVDEATTLWGFATRGETRFFRYAVAGGIATLCDLLILYILTSKVGVYYLIAAAIGFCVGALINYSINRQWGFRGTKIKFLYGFISFFLIGVIALVMTLGFMAILVEYFGVDYMTARIVTLVVVLPWNYIMNKKYTF